jgi:hypothetical protein
VTIGCKTSQIPELELVSSCSSCPIYSTANSDEFAVYQNVLNFISIADHGDMCSHARFRDGRKRG